MLLWAIACYVSTSSWPSPKYCWTLPSYGSGGCAFPSSRTEPQRRVFCVSPYSVNVFPHERAVCLLTPDHPKAHRTCICLYRRQSFWQTYDIWSAFSQPYQKIFFSRIGTEKLLPTALHLPVVLKKMPVCRATALSSCLISFTADLWILSMPSGRQKYQAKQEKQSLHVVCIREIADIFPIHWTYDKPFWT